MDTRDKIIDNALKLFNRDGWREVSVREVAESLDISPGNLTYHFPRKEDLVKSILLELWRNEKASYKAYLQGPRTIALFLAVVSRIFREQLDNHGILSAQYLFYDDLKDLLDKDDNIRGIDDIKRSLFRDILNGLASSGELNVGEEDISFLVSFMILFTRSWILDHSLDGEADVQRYIYLLAQQLYYFASDSGMASIDTFLEDFVS